MTKVVIIDAIGNDPSTLIAAIQRDALEVIYASQENWRELVKNADAIIVDHTRIDADVIESMQNCQIIAEQGIGVDNIDVSAAVKKGIIVSNVPEYCSDEVAEHTLSLILALQRRLRQSQMDIEGGHWDQLSYRGIRKASETKVGIVGLGRLGTAVAVKLLALGYKVNAFDPSPGISIPNGVEVVDLESLAKNSDFLTLHVPLLASTKNIINRELLSKMTEGSFIVNASRGGLVDEEALVAALDNGQIAGAALDVFACEPVPDNSPLLGRSNVILTPHMAFFSEDSLNALQEKVAQEVLNVLSGLPATNPVHN